MDWIVSAFADEAGPAAPTQIAALQRAGLKYIDIRSVDGYNITVLPEGAAKELKKRLDDAGISVNMFGSPIGKIDISEDFNTDMARLRHLGKLAPILGCNAVRIFSYYNREGKPAEEHEKTSMEWVTALRDEAATLGLCLYHENESDILGSLCSGILRLATLRNDHFKLIFDFDNYVQNDENAWENWQQLKDLTDAFHLKDSASKMHTPVGQGDGQVKKILADALARGWSGPLSIEPHLSHSGAVAATGPGGIANEQFSELPTEESFHIACEAAKTLISEIGAPME